MTAKKKTRSGTQWSEEDYRAHGWVQRKLRLSMEISDALDGIADDLGCGVSEAVTILIEREIGKAKRARRGRR